MSAPDPLRLVKLVTVADAFEAKVLAARLGAEGIVWELRGGIDGPYPMGPVHVFVLARDLDHAREVLDAPLVDDADPDPDDPDDPGGPLSRPPALGLFLLLGTVTLMLAWTVGRLLL